MARSSRYDSTYAHHLITQGMSPRDVFEGVGAGYTRCPECGQYTCQCSDKEPDEAETPQAL